MRPLRIIVAVAFVAAAVLPATAQGGSGWRLSVEGASGSSYWFDVTARTQLPNAGSFSRLVHGTGWSGVALVKPSRNIDAAVVFVALDLPASMRCPGTTCAWTVPPPDLTSDSDGYLAPGHYRLVLLGPAGTRVAADVSSLVGDARWAPHRSAPAVRLYTASTHGRAAAGRELALHDFHSMPGGHEFGVTWSVQYFVVRPVGLIESMPCITDGPTDTPIGSAGGVAPCADFQGVDFLGGASVGTTYYAPAPVGYAPIGAGAAGSYGLQDDRPSGVGWDATVAAPTSYLGDVFVGFALPF